MPTWYNCTHTVTFHLPFFFYLIWTLYIVVSCSLWQHCGFSLRVPQSTIVIPRGRQLPRWRSLSLHVSPSTLSHRWNAQFLSISIAITLKLCNVCLCGSVNNASNVCSVLWADALWSSDCSCSRVLWSKSWLCVVTSPTPLPCTV